MRQPCSIACRCESLETRRLFSSIVVSQTGDSGPGSLRQAIMDANLAGYSTIIFDIPATGVQTIDLTSPLPAINVPVTINGRSQPGYSISPIININGALAGNTAIGLRVLGGYSIIKGLGIEQFGGGCIKLADGPADAVYGCYLGFNPGNFLATSAAAFPTTNNFGVLLSGSDQTTIGGTGWQRNVISGNTGDGVVVQGSISSLNVMGNYIGTNPAGTASIANWGAGLNLDYSSSGPTSNIYVGGINIGPKTLSNGNLISGNDGNGVVVNASDSGGLTFYGNFIGTDFTGGVAMGNGGSGIRLRSGSGAIIGNMNPGYGNIIAFNGASGVSITSSTGNSIIGNSIFGNSALGIDLGNTRMPSVNTLGGAHNFPLLYTAQTDSLGTIVTGKLNAAPNTNYKIDLYVNYSLSNGFSQGKRYLDEIDVTTGPKGNASFTDPYIPVLSVGKSITATATDLFGSTSEFGSLVAVTTF